MELINQNLNGVFGSYDSYQHEAIKPHFQESFTPSASRLNNKLPFWKKHDLFPFLDLRDRIIANVSTVRNLTHCCACLRFQSEYQAYLVIYEKLHPPII